MKKSLFILLLITITMGLLLIPGIVSAQNKVIINVLTQPDVNGSFLNNTFQNLKKKKISMLFFTILLN